MNIGIDIDGVMVDTINFVAEELSDIVGREITPYQVAHGLGKVEGIDGIFEEHGERFLCSLNPFENAVDAINKINDEHEVYIISARFHAHYDITVDWMRKHGIQFNKVIFTQGKSKIDVCRQHDIDLFVEDSVVNAEEMADEGIRVIIYSTDYNRELDRKDIIRCVDWTTVLNTVENIKIENDK